LIDTHVANGGFTVTFPDDTTERVFLGRPISVQDLAAHQAMYHFTGSGGHKFCFKCLNNYSSKSALVDEDGDDLIRCDIITRSGLDRATDADVLTAIDRLAAMYPIDPPGVFKRRQTALGYTYHPCHFLYCAMTRAFYSPVSGFMHDWMHCMVVQGVVNTALFVIMEDFRAVGETYDVFHDYMALYTWPKLFGGKPEVFSKKRVEAFRRAKKANERRQVKMQASEALTIMPVMAFRVVRVIAPTGSCPLACSVFIAMHALMELLLAVPHGFVTEAMLLESVEHFLQTFRSVYGPELMHPKFHALLHLPEELGRCGFLLTCWVHERKHKVAKEFATFMRNTQAFERGVVSEAVCKQLANLRQPWAFKRTAGLVSPSLCSTRLADYAREVFDVSVHTEVFHGAVMRHSSCSMSKRKDVVLISGTAVNRPHRQFAAGEVLHHLEVFRRPDQVPCSVVSLWELVEFNSDEGYAVWNVEYRPTIIEAELVLESLIYRAAEGEALTLIPSRFR
jgi:hypothetical protein